MSVFKGLPAYTADFYYNSRPRREGKIFLMILDGGYGCLVQYFVDLVEGYKEKLIAIEKSIESLSFEE